MRKPAGLRWREYSKWTGNTAYGKMLDGPSNVKLKKDLIKREAAKDLSTPYLLIIDEAWKLFETPSGQLCTGSLPYL